MDYNPATSRVLGSRPVWKRGRADRRSAAPRIVAPRVWVAAQQMTGKEASTAGSLAGGAAWRHTDIEYLFPRILPW